MNDLPGSVPAWHAHAECRGRAAFTEWPIEDQKPLCDRCPVRLECLQYGLGQPYRMRDSATYGGLTGRELDKLKRSMR